MIFDDFKNAAKFAIDRLYALERIERADDERYEDPDSDEWLEEPEHSLPPPQPRRALPQQTALRNCTRRAAITFGANGEIVKVRLLSDKCDRCGETLVRSDGTRAHPRDADLRSHGTILRADEFERRGRGK